MIDKRLLNLVPSSKRYIFLTVLCYLLSLVANVIFIFFIGNGLNSLFERGVWMNSIWTSLLLMAGVFFLRYIATLMSTKYSYLASSKVKSILRAQIYQKVLALGTSYNEKISTSDLIQTSLEGVEQLEIYFSRYLPQLFYSFLAPIFLFILIFPISANPAIVLLACVPLIPISIMAVYKIAGKLFKKYWGIYVNMGNSFLDNIRGLTTLKIYLADERKHKEMNESAEDFRRITMKVLTMQLNSTTIMDFIAFGGAGLGALFTLLELQKGRIGIAQSFIIIMLSAEFFIPLRRLGSFFHIAMNGMSAKKKIFTLLDLPLPDRGSLQVQGSGIDISIKNIAFSYDESREILKDVSIQIPDKSFVSVVGGSGSGKSTIASLVTGRYCNY
ncbi:MAG: ABC transporter transmembrane domain-containing protein, partial [Filifactor alocis]|nr:ABC transporter transmembrane domain-containing protein [Filifactor alocis]